MENAKTCRSTLTENTEKSEVCGHRKMSKAHRSQIYTNKLPGLQAQQNENNAYVSIYAKMPKTRRSAVKEKRQKLVGPQSQKYANKFPDSQSQKMKKNA